MARERGANRVPVLAFGVVAFLVACLSILDMFLPRPYDGVVLDLDDAQELQVRSVVSGTGAAIAGIGAGDHIVGVGNEIIRNPADAARALQRHSIGERVPYLIDRSGTLTEVQVELGRRRLGSGLYAYACFSGFLFFFIGLYVLVQRPNAAQQAPTLIFFVLCTLFLLFLVCGLRPLSYSWVDKVVQTTGLLSMLLLPAAFLHFFLYFPKRLQLSLGSAIAEVFAEPGVSGETTAGRAARAVERLFNESPAFIRVIYLLPLLLYAGTLVVTVAFGVRFPLVWGTPSPSWVLMLDYLVLGLLALLASLLGAREGRERRQIATVFAGTVGGITPFLVLGIVMPWLLHSDSYVLWGVVPLILVPLTFAYAIVRFQFFEIRVIVRRSVLYTVTTAVVAVAYALGIAAFNLVFRDAAVGRSPFFFLVLAFAILALFDPLRKRFQEPIDRFFFREVYDARRAMEEVSEAVVHELSAHKLEALLTTRLKEIMHLEWAALYRREGRAFVTRGAEGVRPAELAADSLLITELARHSSPLRSVDLEPLKALDPRLRDTLTRLAASGSPLYVPLAFRRQLHALLLLGPRLSGEDFTKDDLQLIRTVANQGAVALENARLIQEQRKQLELEKELEIARQVQFSLIPQSLPVPAGWQVAARCQPARQVGGDFYDALPGLDESQVALVVGDVSGKSVSGAMLMVATREILHTAALRGASPTEMLKVANQRLYAPTHRLFVALAYLLLSPDGSGIYALAGQPAPLLRRASGHVEELPAPAHRLPVGALRDAEWDLLKLQLEPGDLLLVYSDGVTEARRGDGEFFGEERLREALAGLSGTPEEVLDGLLARVEEFAAGADPYDDLTVLALLWEGTKA
jgi:serine phosphatase RsbU (regulator of sigma subunit)